MSVLPDSAQVDGGRLMIGGVGAAELAEEYGTPLYVYCAETLRGRAAAYLRGLDSYPGRRGPCSRARRTRPSRCCERCSARGWAPTSPRRGSWPPRCGRAPIRRSIVVHGNNPSERELRAAIEAHAGLIVVDHAGELRRSTAWPARPGVCSGYWCG